MKVEQVRKIARALPEVTEEPHFDYASFRVRGKIFATVPPDDQHLHLFVGEDDRDMALSMHPDFLEKLTWGKSVVGLRVTLPKADVEFISHLIERAWRAKAPKSLNPGKRSTRR